MKKYRYSHHLTESQAALGKPVPANTGRQQTGLAIALKPAAKVIDIAKNPGYTVVIHKKPLLFPV
jgi:hypothetical protein